MIDAPETVYTIPPVYHRHEWKLYTFVIYDKPNMEAAFCKVEGCDAELTREQVESILNGGMVLTDE